MQFIIIKKGAKCMKSSRKISVIIVLLAAFMFLSLQSMSALAQTWSTLPPFGNFLSSLPPALPPVNQFAGITTPLIPQPFSSFARSAAIPIPGGGGAVAAPTLITTNWTGSWYSLINNNNLGPMNLTLSVNPSTGSINGTVWFILHKLVPLPTTVSGTYTGVGTAFVLTGVYTDFQLAFGGLFLIPIDYYITVQGEIIGGTLLVGSYAIESLQQSDFGGINLNVI
jgi:hypothetical protein